MYVSSPTSVQSEVRETQCAQLNGRINYLLEHLAALVSQLEDTIYPICRPAHESAETNKREVTPARPKMFEELHGNLEGIESQLVRLRSVIARIEL